MWRQKKISKEEILFRYLLEYRGVQVYRKEKDSGRVEDIIFCFIVFIFVIKFLDMHFGDSFVLVYEWFYISIRNFIWLKFFEFQKNQVSILVLLVLNKFGGILFKGNIWNFGKVLRSLCVIFLGYLCYIVYIKIINRLY